MSWSLLKRAPVLVFAVALLTVVTGLTAGLSGDRVVVVERADTGQVLLTHPVEDGTHVALEYTHSVEKSRVYDGYTVSGTTLEMTRMEFESYGWGLPAGADVTRDDGTFVYDPPGDVDELVVATGRTAGHRLHVGDRTYDLAERANAETVRITVQRRAWFTRLL